MCFSFQHSIPLVDPRQPIVRLVQHCRYISSLTIYIVHFELLLNWYMPGNLKNKLRNFTHQWLSSFVDGWYIIDNVLGRLVTIFVPHVVQEWDALLWCVRAQLEWLPADFKIINVLCLFTCYVKLPLANPTPKQISYKMITSNTLFCMSRWKSEYWMLQQSKYNTNIVGSMKRINQ